MSKTVSAIEYLIGWRYIRSKKRGYLVSMVSLISILGIAIGVAVIITVLSVMNGFREEITARMLDMLSHNMVTASPSGVLRDWQPLQRALEERDDVIAAAPVVETQGILVNGERVSGAYLRGILPAADSGAAAIEARVVTGSLAQLQPDAYRIVLGSSLANYLRVGVGDRVTVMTAKGMTTPAGMIPRMRRLHVSGIFESGLSEFDRYIALMHLDDVGKIARMERGHISALHLQIDDILAAPRITRELRSRLGPDYWVSDWTKSHRNFFRALEMEKLLLLIIMLLIVVVAMFNIVSMLMMVVMEKRGDIAILRTIGMRSRQVMRIFITQGCLIGILGNTLGVAGGIALAGNLEALIRALEDTFGFRFLSPDVYPITRVPSQLLAEDVIIVASLTFILTVGATIYPAWKAARIRPAEVLKAN